MNFTQSDTIIIKLTLEARLCCFEDFKVFNPSTNTGTTYRVLLLIQTYSKKKTSGQNTDNVLLHKNNDSYYFRQE